MFRARRGRDGRRPAADVPAADDAPTAARRACRRPTARRRRAPKPRPTGTDDAATDDADRRADRRSRDRTSRRPTSARCSRSCVPSRPTTPAADAGRRRRRRRARRSSSVVEAVDVEPRCEPTRRRADEADGRRRPGRRRPRHDRRATPPWPRPPTTSSRRGKRALQDEQNDLLDGLRRQRGKIDVAKVLPPIDDQVDPLGARAPAGGRHRLRGRRRPRCAGAEAAAPVAAPRPRALLTELATAVVTPAPRAARRARSSRSTPARRPTPRSRSPRASAPATGSGGASTLEGVLGDVLAAAYVAGRVRRRARRRRACAGCRAVVGKCPDCDDNALEPTVKGERLPHRPAAPARAPGLSLPPRGRHAS